ncbi:MAG: signal peptide peptidase SppA, partial [Muribaculaceae bacterium]|nr:signal peptide peptidase SppA [Muribaculaceae bacterium]
VDEIEQLTSDPDNLAGLILRVNSPGGSAFASEQIWEALERFKKETELPFYVSMGDVAASGGYYISCGADKIFAQPTTITGSIGIFGLIPEFKELINDRLGMNTTTVKTNANGNFPSPFNPMTDVQRQKMQAYIERGYDTFTRRCAEGRHVSQDSIKVIAEGRVWDGATAMTIGLVDSLGSLHSTILAMASDLGLDRYTVATYPKASEKWWENLLEMDELMATTGLDSETLSMLRKANELKKAPRVQCRMEDVIIK